MAADAQAAYISRSTADMVLTVKCGCSCLPSRDIGVARNESYSSLLLRSGSQALAQFYIFSSGQPSHPQVERGNQQSPNYNKTGQCGGFLYKYSIGKSNEQIISQIFTCSLPWLCDNGLNSHKDIYKCNIYYFAGFDHIATMYQVMMFWIKWISISY